MTFRELCEQYELTEKEKRQAAIYLIALRLAQAWEALIGG